MTLAVRRVRPGDVEDIRAVFDMADFKHWPEHAQWWIVRDEWGAVAAYAAAGVTVDAETDGDTEAKMILSWVRPDMRGLGLQKRLIRARVRWARSCGASKIETYTWGGNLPSMRSLWRCGFVPFRRDWDGQRSWIFWTKPL